MARAAPSPDDTLPPEERAFQKVMSQIGGKDKLYLVSEACDNRDDDNEEETGVMKEFVRDMFYNLHADSAAEERPCRNNNSSGGEWNPSSVETNHQTTTSSSSDNGEVGTKEKKPPPSESPLDLGSIGVAAPAGGGGGGGSPRPPNGDLQRLASKTVNTSGRHRTIASPVVIFIFSQRFLQGMSSDDDACLREILKDVRARTRGRARAPALMGLVRAAGAECGETRRCVDVLERSIRSVFRKRAQEAIWVGTFVPASQSSVLAVKENVCRVWHASQAADNTRDGMRSCNWPCRCLPWPVRREPRGHACSSSTSKQRGDTGSPEEGIPLKTNLSMSTGSHTECGTTVGDN